jgi:hypothetical protein
LIFITDIENRKGFKGKEALLAGVVVAVVLLVAISIVMTVVIVKRKQRLNKRRTYAEKLIVIVYDMIWIS